MYIAQVFNYLHNGWRYAVGAVAVFLVSQLGAIPFIAVATMKVMAEGGDLSALEDESRLMTILDSNLTLFLMLLSFVFGLIALYFIVKYLHKQPFKTLTTARKRTDWGRVWFGFGLIVFSTVVLTLIDYYANPEDYICLLYTSPSPRDS